MLTRWNTWYEAIEYLSEFLEYIRDFVIKEQAEQDKSEIINAIVDLLKNQEDFNEIKLLVTFSHTHAKDFYDIIKIFENTQGITQKAYNLINNKYNRLRFSSFLIDFGNDIDNLITSTSMSTEYWHNEFRKV